MIGCSDFDRARQAVPLKDQRGFGQNGRGVRYEKKQKNPDMPNNISSS